MPWYKLSKYLNTLKKCFSLPFQLENNQWHLVFRSYVSSSNADANNMTNKLWKLLVYDPFDVLLDLVCCYFVEDLCVSVRWRCWPVILFLVLSLSDFAIGVILASWNEFGSLPSSSVFWMSVRRIGVNSFKCLVKFSLCDYLVLNFSLWGDTWSLSQSAY